MNRIIIHGVSTFHLVVSVIKDGTFGFKDYSKYLKDLKMGPASSKLKV